MQKIEPSSRLYAENGARYMTATMMCRSGTDNPTTTAMTFILADRRLITVSYDEPRPFTLVKNLLGRRGIPHSRHDPKILWVDDAEIVGDRITKVRPIPRNLFTQKTERRIGELGTSCVALVVSDVSVHEAP